jgi:hypothetical protein
MPAEGQEARVHVSVCSLGVGDASRRYVEKTLEVEGYIAKTFHGVFLRDQHCKNTLIRMSFGENSINNNSSMLMNFLYGDHQADVDGKALRGVFVGRIANSPTGDVFYVDKVVRVWVTEPWS